MHGVRTLQVVKIVFWRDGDSWLGYLRDYPDFWTQGPSLDDIVDHLRDIYADLADGLITSR